MNFIVKYLSHIIFAAVAGYFAFLAFLVEKDPMINKMILIIVLGLWILWIFAKSFLKILAAIVLVAGMLLAGYYVLHADEIECKKSGREWNKELKVCEDKKSIVEKAQGYLRKWLKENIKLEKAQEQEKPQVSVDLPQQ